MVLRAVDAAARALGLAGKPVLVAVSGGVDSSVAPAALREGGPSRSRPTLQEAARRLRYQALQAMAEESGATRIATAHTLDDQAETVLLRLLRGSGPDGLGGIPERSPDGRVVRPLLGVPREAIERFARERCLPWREDPSNRSGSYARGRLRVDWLPRFGEAFNRDWLRAVAHLAEAQRRDSEWIEQQVEREAADLFSADGGGLRIAAVGWEDRPEALARRLARLALRRCGAGRDVSRIHLERMLGFLRSGRPGAGIELPGGLLMRRQRDHFRLGPRDGRAPGAAGAGC
jgi:tRNA(Ile)-lysidine synthase